VITIVFVGGHRPSIHMNGWWAVPTLRDYPALIPSGPPPPGPHCHGGDGLPVETGHGMSLSRQEGPSPARNQRVSSGLGHITPAGWPILAIRPIRAYNRNKYDLFARSRPDKIMRAHWPEARHMRAVAFLARTDPTAMTRRA
jgi:hypothetical protein